MNAQGDRAGHFAPMISKRFLYLLTPLILATCLAAQVIPYDFPGGFPVSRNHSAQVSGAAVPALQTERGAFLSFGMTGPVEAKVKLGNFPIRIHPSSL
jgi:hypothetical protein